MRRPTRRIEAEEEISRLRTERRRQAIERAASVKARDADKRKAQRLKDLALVVGLTLTSAVLFMLLDVFERFYSATRQWERWELDDILLSFVVLAVCLAWFSCRRWKEALLEITEREQIEEALRTSKHFVDSIVRAAPSFIYVIDLINERYVYVNNAYERVLGYPRERVLADDGYLFIQSRLHPDDLQDVMDRQRSILKRVNGQPQWLRRDDVYDFVYRVKDAEDHWHWIQSWGVIFETTDDDTVLQVLGVAEDITERKQVEEALRESEERFKVALKDSPTVVFNQDKQLRYTWVYNPTRFTAEEIIGKTDAELLPPDVASRLTELKRRVLDQEVRMREEVRSVIEGNVFFYDMTVEPLRDTFGTIAGITCASTDITERKQAEDALQQFAERLKTLRQIDQAILTAQSPEAIAEAALTHIRKLVPCWRASATMFDREAHEARLIAVRVDGETRVGTGLRLSLSDLTGLDRMRQGRINRVEDVQTLAQPAPVVQALQAEGLASYISVPLRARGELIGTLHLASDGPWAFSSDEIEIAREVADVMAVALQQARLFEELHAAHERLQSLSRQLVEVQEAERRHLARELHDEIGQILTAVQMSLQAARQVPEAATRVPVLEEGISAVDRALEQIHTLSFDLRPALLDDLGLVPALRWYVDRQAQQAGFTAHVIADAFEERLPPTLEITCFRVVQEALTNVIRHAQARQVQVELQNRETEVELVVRDDGVGFDVEAAMERAAHGASLGLLSMQERVRLVGGQFKIVATAGRGTRIHARFSLYAPEKHDKKRGAS